MGNCLVLQGKIIKIMKTDGKILEYNAPIKVHQVLSEFSGHAICDELPVVQYLQQEARLLGGHLYYLVPLPLPSPEAKKKKVRFSNPEVEDEKGTNFVRIKLVISKQELQQMLQKGGVSVDDMISHLQGDQRMHKVDVSNDKDNCKGWKPALESIAEVN